MDFNPSPELQALRTRVREFMNTHVLPNERSIINEDRAGEIATLRDQQAKAREAGLWTPHLPEDFGGLGLGPMGMATLFREMGRSLVGAICFNCDAPDQGNMDLLLRKGSHEIKEKYLRPLVDAEITSAFCMTEPAPGAGADPRNLATTATEVDGGWEINGHKWFSTGGGKAAFLIVMARTSDDRRHGASMFVVDRHAAGVEHVRDVGTMSEPLLAHHESEMRFNSVRVGPEAVLGEIGQGFQMAQARLVPARLTHCMRWLGLAERTLQLCRDYITRRESFGKVLARHQLVQKMVAENALAVHAGNLMTMHCAWMLQQGLDKEARAYSSMCKLHVAQLSCKVLDDAIQMHGALGYSTDMPFGDWYRAMRAARIADGPDEVHLVVIAREFLMRDLNLLV